MGAAMSNRLMIPKNSRKSCDVGIPVLYNGMNLRDNGA